MAVKKKEKIRVLGKELRRFSMLDLEEILSYRPEVLGIQEEQGDLNFWRDTEYNYGDNDVEYLVVQEYKLETDEQYQKRLGIEKESKAKEKKRKEDKEGEERALLAKLKAKYEPAS